MGQVKNKISVTFLKSLINQYDKEEISLSRMAELINEKIAQYDAIAEITRENKPITGEDVAALLHWIHGLYPETHSQVGAEQIIYFEEDLLPVLEALGLPAPVWGKSMSLEEWEKQRQ